MTEYEEKIRSLMDRIDKIIEDDKKNIESRKDEPGYKTIYLLDQLIEQKKQEIANLEQQKKDYHDLRVQMEKDLAQHSKPKKPRKK